MSDDLFPIEPSAPTPLQEARQRLAKAQAEVERVAESLRNKTPLHFHASLEAYRELGSAENSVEVEENKALEKLKQTK